MSSTRNTSIPERLFRLALPVVGLNLLGVLALAVDTGMCARLPGREAELSLTALSIASQLVFLLTVAMMGLAVGSVAMVSRAHGAGDRERVEHILRQSTQLTVLVGVAVALIGNLSARWMVRGLGASEAVTDLAVAYLRPTFTFSVFYFVFILYAAILRGLRQTLLPFVVSLATNTLNVVLNYALIFGEWHAPRLGIVGAAVATVVSQAVGAFVLVHLLMRGRVPGLVLTLRPKRLDPPLARQLFRIGAPAALDMVVLNVSFLSIVWMLAFFDEVAVAAHGIGLRVQSMAFVPGLGISQATGAMVGNALGAREPMEARTVTRAGVALATSVMTLLGFGLVASAEPLVEHVFNVAAGTALHGHSVTWMRVLGFGMPILGVHIALIGTLRGAGATRTSLRINVVGTLLFQIPLSFFLGFVLEMGPFGIWIALPISYFVRMLLGILAYHRGHWAQLGLSAGE